MLPHALSFILCGFTTEYYRKHAYLNLPPFRLLVIAKITRNVPFGLGHGIFVYSFISPGQRTVPGLSLEVFQIDVSPLNESSLAWPSSFVTLLSCPPWPEPCSRLPELRMRVQHRFRGNATLRIFISLIKQVARWRSSFSRTENNSYILINNNNEINQEVKGWIKQERWISLICYRNLFCAC